MPLFLPVIVYLSYWAIKVTFQDTSNTIMPLQKQLASKRKLKTPLETYICNLFSFHWYCNRPGSK
jgi:hypothetical protein